MKKYKLLKLFLSLKKSQEKGISLIELIVALVISGIVLTMAASGFVNVLRANQDVESKTVRNAGLQRALAFLQEDIKQATKITRETAGSTQCPSSDIDSAECLKLEMSDDRDVYYGYEDISVGTNIFLKPGILKRQAYIRSTGDAIDDSDPSNPETIPITGGQQTPWEQEYTTMADGLINDTPSQMPTCDQDGINWDTTEWSTTLYGADSNQKGGFRFCLQNDDISSTNRLVRVFLHGTTIVGGTNSQLEVNTIGFGRSQASP